MRAPLLLGQIVGIVEFTVDCVGGMCPAQAVGRLADERPFYFRARRGESFWRWSAWVSPRTTGTDSSAPGTQELAWVIAAGEDPTGGWMPEDTVRELLQEQLGRLVDPLLPRKWLERTLMPLSARSCRDSNAQDCREEVRDLSARAQVLTVRVVGRDKD